MESYLQLQKSGVAPSLLMLGQETSLPLFHTLAKFLTVPSSSINFNKTLQDLKQKPLDVDGRNCFPVCNLYFKKDYINYFVFLELANFCCQNLT